MSALPVRTVFLRRGLALGLGAVLLLACGDAATDPTDDDSDDDQSSSSSSGGSSSSGRASSSSGSSSGRPSSSSSSSSGSSGGSSSSGSSSSSSGSSSSSTSSSSSGGPLLYTVGGSVDGYEGTGLQLQLGAQTLTVAQGADSWIFAEGLPQDATYEVQVAAQPSQPTQLCTVANGSGDIDGENVDDVEITCTTIAAHLVRVATTGLVGSVTLANNGADPLVVNGPAATFATALASGAPYDVTVSTQPPGQTCAVTNGSGVIAAADVTVNVTCTTNPLEPLGGIVVGLTGPGLVLANGADQLPVDAESEFEMPAGVAVGAPYNVTVATQPPGQLCTVTDGQGVMVAGGFDDVIVECTVASYPVTVTVSGLEADSVVVNNGADRVVAANGSFSYDVAPGGAYEVKVARNPRSPRQTCTVSNGVGVVNGPVAVQITCVTDCAQLVINEVQAAGADNANQEFVEIFNKGTCEVDFDDYKLDYKATNNNNGLHLEADRKIPAGGYLVFGSTQFAGPTDVTFAAGIAANGQLAILLKTTNQPVDGVAWGAVQNGAFTEGTPATAPGTKVIARVPNGKDTHVNSADFVVQNATPKAAN